MPSPGTLAMGSTRGNERLPERKTLRSGAGSPILLPMKQSDVPQIRALIAPVTPLQQNCTIVWCAKTLKAAVIDPGGEVDRLLAAIDGQGLTLEKIWITHGHMDHAGGTAALKDATGVPIEGPHPDDQFWIDRIAESGEKYGMQGARSFTPDRWLGDGDVVTLGETEFEVLHCPGHTPGHVIFFHRQARFAQVGDVLFQGSIGRSDFPRGDHNQLIASITEKLWPLGDDVRFVPGHGPMSSFGVERRLNPFVSDDAIEMARSMQA
jgi:hydroxyacylglutathione hydrolase